MSEQDPRPTADELGLYFIRNITGGNWDIYVTNRREISGDFMAPMLVVGPSTTESNEYNPTVTADGLTMYFASNGGPLGSDINLFVSTRTSLVTEFSSRAPIPALNTTDDDRSPYVLPDGRALYFSRYSTSTGASEKIYRAPIGLTGVGTPVEVMGLDAVMSHGFPVVTPDERTIYFMNSLGGPSDIWMATRASAADPFGTPTPVSEVNQVGAYEEPGWISSDGCVLYFSSDRAGSTRTDLYAAQRGH